MVRRASFAATALVLFMGCDSGMPSSLADPTSSATMDLSALPSETAWARGTRWSWEEDFAGLPRAWVYRPTSFSKRVPGKRGVVFHLPGCGQLPHQVAQGAGWPKVAEDHGLVIVVPAIIAPSHPYGSAPNVACYNFGSSFSTWPTRWWPDHAALISAGRYIVRDRTDLAIDPRQVYLAGFSSGATVAMQVACMAPDVFAGVGSVSAPAIGTDQVRAVMPPTVTASDVRGYCTWYAETSPLSHPMGALATQVYALVSDNNGLPAGNPVFEDGHWTADKFRDQTFWDGDKYVPHAHHELIARAMAPLLGATRRRTAAPLGPTGTGSGCPGGEQSRGDANATQCMYAQAVQRQWTVGATFWEDASGKTRIALLEQDTLRHRWPAGPAGPLDHVATPTRAALIAAGYIRPDGQFDVDKVDRAPNGQLGALFLANDTFDFPSYFAQLMSENNPRLDLPLW